MHGIFLSDGLRVNRSTRSDLPGCLLAGLVVLLTSAWTSAQGPTIQMPPAPVVVATVQQREVPAGQTFVGTVVPLRVSTVGSPVEGRVINFPVNEGDCVSRGQMLAKLRTKSLKIQLAAAEAELELREEELLELENGSRPEEITQAEGDLQAAEGLAGLAQSRFNRATALFERNAVSVDEVEEQKSAKESAQGGLIAAKAALELAEAGPRAEQIEQARARVLIQEEIIRQLQDDIREHTVVAPFDGYVTQEHTEIGQWIAKGGAVAEVVELHDVDVEVALLEKYLSQLLVGATARVEIEALPGKIRIGRVALIVPQADVRSRSFPVKVRLENEGTQDGGGSGDVMIKPGMFARVTLPVGGKASATMVLKDALVLGESSTTVWVVDADPKAEPGGQGTARPVPVELGVADDGWIEVRGPLEPGQLVVVEGNERIIPGQPVRILDSIGAAAGAEKTTNGSSSKGGN